MACQLLGATGKVPELRFGDSKKFHGYMVSCFKTSLEWSRVAEDAATLNIIGPIERRKSQRRLENRWRISRHMRTLTC